MANELDFLFTPGYQTSYDDPDGSKRRAAQSLEISGKPGTIEKVLGQLPNMQLPQAPDPAQQMQQKQQQQRMELEFLMGLGGQPKMTEAGQPGEFSKGVSRGMQQIKADLIATGGTVAQLFGADEVASSAYQKYSEIMAEAQKYPAAIGKIEDVDSPGAFVNYFAGLLGEQTPIIASILATGGVGSLIGRAAAKGAISGMAAKQAAEKVAQWGLRGATGGVVAGTTGIETGGMTGEQVEAGVPVQPGMNLLLGTAAGAAEAVSPIVLARMLGLKLPMATNLANKITETMAEKGLLARMGTGALTIGATEAGTEVFQEALAIAARKFADENYEVLGEESASRVLNAAAGGALIGGLFGGLGGIRRQPPAEMQPEQDPQLQLPAPQLRLPAPDSTTDGTGPTDGADPTGPALLPAPPESQFGSVRQGHLPAEPVILFTEQGKESVDPDAITARTGEITEALSAPESRTMAQQALIREVEQQRLADFRRMFEVKQPSPTLGKLISLRSTLSESETQSPQVQAKIEKLSEMIDEQAKTEEIEIPKSTYLNEKENARLAYLLEKDKTEGLTQKEVDTLERLSAKSLGEKKASRIAPTEKNVAAFEAEVNEAMKGEGPLYSDVTGSTLTGLTPEQFEKLIAPIRNPNVPLNIMEHPAQLRGAPNLQKYILKSGKKVRGAYSNGMMHFFTRNLTADSAIRVYLHEMAHFGLHNVVPPDVLKNILSLVERTHSEWVNTYLANRNMDMKNAQNRARGAEEYIAHLAEDGHDMPVLRKIIAIIRRWLRGIMPSLRISDDEIRVILQGLSTELKGPQSTSKLAPSLQAYRYVMSDDEYNTGYTMRIVDRLRKEKREEVTAKYVRQVMKEAKMNEAERHIIEETLTNLGTDRFTRREFEYVLKTKIVPLKVNMTAKHSAYGLVNIGLTNGHARVRGGGTSVYEAPFDTGGSHHFPNPNYIGHVRWFVGPASASSAYGDLAKREWVRSIVEIQSDRSQRDGALTAQMKNKLTPEEKELKLQQLKDEFLLLDGILKKIQDSIDRWDFNPKHETSNMSVQEIEQLTAQSNSHIGFEPEFNQEMTPGEKAVFLRELEEELSLRAADLDENIQRLTSTTPDTGVELAHMYPALFKRMVREEVRQTAQHGIKKLRIASVSTMAHVEGWVNIANSMVVEEDGTAIVPDITAIQKKPGEIIKFIPQSYQIIAIRHNDLTKWIQQNYTAPLVVDDNGHTWYEIDVKEKYAEEDVMAYFSDVAQDARNIGKELNTDYSLSAKSVEKLSHMWRIKAATMALAPLQLVQKYGVAPLQRYIDRVDNWARTKSEIQAPADETVESWMQLPKEDASNVSKALFEATILSDEKQAKLSPEEEAALLRKYKIEGKAQEVYQSVKSFFVDILGRLENGLKYNAARETMGNEEAANRFLADWASTANDSTARANLVANLALDPGVSINLTRRIQDIEKEMGKLRNRNYFPFMRFGKYTVTAKDTKGETVGFWTFSNAKEQEDFYKNGDEVKAAKLQGQKVAMSVMTDTQFAFLGMPPSFMEALQGELELSQTQRDQLKEIFIRHSPGRAFLRQLIKRKGIEGFSQDAMRVFSTYALNASNHLARVENYLDMDKALAEFKELRYEMEERTGDSRGIMTLYNSFQEHRHYIMNPGNELANLRAMGFMWYLGFNVKSALVNLTQVPMVAYPYLASRYGDASSISELMGAMKTAAGVFRGKQGFDPTMDQLIARGIREGFLDESLATELAGIAEGSALMRMIPTDQAQRKLNQFSYYGAYLFRNAEKFARIVAFTAAVKLEQKKGGDIDTMFQAGKETVRATMFEYAKWNRPKFMRGPASVFFLFWTFMQNMAYISFGGQGAQTAMRVWIMLVLMAGLQGLPFAENLLDVLDWGNEKIRRALGIKGHYRDLRSEIREMLQSITDNPDIIMHGLARYYGLGPLHLLSMMGVPIPNTDTSGSLSMGRVIPGIKELTGSERNPDEKFGRTIAELAGPVFGMPYTLWKAVESNDPDTWKRFERAMPTAMKAASKAGRYFARGQEEFRGGGAVAKFSPYDVQQQAEVVAQTFGFTPTRVTQRYELRAAQQMMKEYFTIRREVLIDNYAFASRNRDREGLADVRQAIKDYNSTVPHNSLRLTSESIKKSLEARQKGAKNRETLTPAEKMWKGAFRDLAEAYPEGSKLK